jgi:hypothetical protein
VALSSACPSEADARLSSGQVAQVAHHLAGGILQHYKLYCAVFCRQQEHVQHSADLLVRALLGLGLGLPHVCSTPGLACPLACLARMHLQQRVACCCLPAATAAWWDGGSACPAAGP